MASLDENGTGTTAMDVLGPMGATVVLGPSGCQVCHSAPEGPAVAGTASVDQLPLLDPPPRYTTSVTMAQQLPKDGSSTTALPFFARCRACLVDRWCEGCNKFWCESCYETDETRTYTRLQKIEASEGRGQPSVRMGIKVHLGLCTEDCLVEEMYNGAGSGGMWG